MYILAAYDRSPHSTYAINALRHLPHREKIDLSLATVARFRPIELWSGLSFTNSPADFIGEEREAIEKSLNEFAATLGIDFNDAGCSVCCACGRSVESQRIIDGNLFARLRFAAYDRSRAILARPLLVV